MNIWVYEWKYESISKGLLPHRRFDWIFNFPVKNKNINTYKIGIKSIIKFFKN